MNEFKFSTLRQFGSENVSFTATVNSEKHALSQAEIDEQILQVHNVIESAFKKTLERELSEKDLLSEQADKRAAQMKKLDDALKAEMEVKKNAGKTIADAQKIRK